MPLSENEQRILAEIEDRLRREDPQLAKTVGRTSLYTHLARRIRWAGVGFVAGFVMLLFFGVSTWLAIGGFAVMLVSALLIYRYLKQLTHDQLRSMRRDARFPFATWLARLSERFRPPDRPDGGTPPHS